mmetsp:Transcript_48776/g.122741  ORF Transcript_48776/g.122741 Transcript_48776/m.122741 type:complete len:146 (+) Transcript_48776:72-509(+)
MKLVLPLSESCPEVRPHASQSWVLLELQGTVCSREHEQLQALRLGRIVDKGEGNAELIIGNHRLDGSLVALSAPLLLCGRSRKNQDKEEQEDRLTEQRSGGESKRARYSSTEEITTQTAHNYKVSGIIWYKYTFKHRPHPILFDE